MRLTIQESNMTGRLDECRAIDLWPMVVGERMARCMSRPRVSCGVMIVYVDNASMRHELTMHRNRLIELINTKLGKDVIKAIRFM